MSCALVAECGEESPAEAPLPSRGGGFQVLILFALLVQNYTILTLRAAARSVEDIIHAPNVLAYSLDRMRLRHTFLRDKGLRLGLASMLSYSTSDFQKRFDHDGDLL